MPRKSASKSRRFNARSVTTLDGKEEFSRAAISPFHIPLERRLQRFGMSRSRRAHREPLRP